MKTNLLLTLLLLGSCLPRIDVPKIPDVQPVPSENQKRELGSFTAFIDTYKCSVCHVQFKDLDQKSERDCDQLIQSAIAAADTMPPGEENVTEDHQNELQTFVSCRA